MPEKDYLHFCFEIAEHHKGSVCLWLNRKPVSPSACEQESRVTFIVNPGRHPLLLLERVKLDFSVFVLQSFLSNPHGVVTRDAVVSFGPFEEATPRV